MRLIDMDEDAPLESFTSRSTRIGPGGNVAEYTCLSLRRVPSDRLH